MNTSAPKSELPPGNAQDFLKAAAAAFDAGKAVRKEAAKTAQANKVPYRQIAEGLNISVTRAWELVNEDLAA